MADKVSAWSAADGTLFLVEQEAKDHDFNTALKAWVKDNVSQPDDFDDVSFETYLLHLLYDERGKLLPIFKMLNGGSGPVIPPSQPPSAEKVVVLSGTQEGAHQDQPAFSK